MYPIQLQKGPRGIGMNYEEFVQTFTNICNEHLKEGRARAFAFIFYDMCGGAVQRALTRIESFNALHVQSGSQMTIFYLHDQAVKSHWRNFNNEFLNALGVIDQALPPCVVFFSVYGEEIEDVSICGIDSLTEDPALVLAEIQGYVADAIKRMNQQGDISALTVVAKIAAPVSAALKIGDLILRLKGVL